MSSPVIPGLGFCLVLVALGALREVAGRGTLFSQAGLMFGEGTLQILPEGFWY